MEIRIVPEPSPAERAALEQALEDLSLRQESLSEWQRAGILENLEQEEEA